MQGRLSLGLRIAYFALSTESKLTPGTQRDSNCICQLVDTDLHPAPGLTVKDDVLGNGLHLRSHVALVRVQLPLPDADDLKYALMFCESHLAILRSAASQYRTRCVCLRLRCLLP